MVIARTAVRILLGLLFIAAGIMSVVVTQPPLMPGPGGQLSLLFAQTHWNWFIGAAQIAIGVLLVINRYVMLALTMLFAFLYNSFAYHITTSPQALPVPIVVLALALFAGWPYRERFGALFAAR